MKLRKILALIMAMAMCLALLTACGNNDTPPETGNPPAETGDSNTGDLPGDGTKYEILVTNHDSESSKGAQFMADLGQKMMDYVAANSTDTLDVIVYNGGSLYGGGEAFGAVESGNCDMAWGAAAFYSGQFPISEFIQLPLNGINSAQMGSKVFMDMAAEIPEVAAEWETVKVIALQGNCPGILSTTAAYGKVESADDLKGLQFRTAGTTAGLWVSAVGMEPVTVSTSDTYEYLEKNIVNGCMNDWHNIDCFNLYDVIGYAMDYCVSTSPCFVIMNQAKYDSFPQHVKDAVDLYSGAYAADMAGWYWDSCVFTTAAEMEAAGVEIYEPSQELYDFMTSDSIKEQVHNEYIAFLNTYDGLDGQAIYDQCMAIVDKYAAEYANIYDTEFTIDQWATSDVATADLEANAATLGITLE